LNIAQQKFRPPAAVGIDLGRQPVAAAQMQYHLMII
jgi:hypothetical protein